MATINRGAVSAKTFNYPEYEPQVAQTGRGSTGGGEAPDDKYFGIPEMAKGLQYTGRMQELAQKYYQDYANLRNMARTLLVNYDIDVTRPDYSRPETVEANRVFHQGIANLAYIGDFLRESQFQFKTAQEAEIAGTYNIDPRSLSTPYAQIAGTPAGGYSTQLPEAFDLAKSNVNRTVDTRGEFNRLMGEAAQFRGPYEQALAEQPNDPRTQYLAQAAEQLSPVYNAPAATSGGTNPDTTRIYLKEWAALTEGTHPSFQPGRIDLNDPQKRRVLVSNIRSNAVLGKYTDAKGAEQPFVINRIEYVPSEGKSYAVNAEGIKRELPKESLNTTVEQDISSNPNRPINAKSLREFYDKYGLGEGGSLRSSDFLGAEDQSIRAGKIAEIEQEAPQIQSAISNLQTQLTSLPSGGWGRFTNLLDSSPNKLEVTLSDGRNITIAREGKDEYKIEDYTTFFGKPDKSGNVQGVPKKYFTGASLPELMQILNRYGVIESRLKSNTTNPSPDAVLYREVNGKQEAVTIEQLRQEGYTDEEIKQALDNIK